MHRSDREIGLGCHKIFGWTPEKADTPQQQQQQRLPHTARCRAPQTTAARACAAVSVRRVGGTRRESGCAKAPSVRSQRCARSSRDLDRLRGLAWLGRLALHGNEFFRSNGFLRGGGREWCG